MEQNAGPRDRILDAAEAVFGARGYRGGALNDVAVAAGYTRAGLLHHFPSKEALLLAVLERRDARLGVSDGMTPPNTLTEMLDVMEAKVLEILEIRPLIQLGHIVEAEAAAPDHPAHKWAADRERRLRDAATDVIRRTQEAGELRSDVDPQSLSALILAVGEGLEAQWLLDDSVDVAAGVRLLRQLIDSLATTT